MRLSQSRIKDCLLPYGGGDPCPYRWKKIGEGVGTAPSSAMLDGLIFEHELLGATAKNGEIPTKGEKRGGGLYKAEQDVRSLARGVEEKVFPHYGIEITEVQKKLVTPTKVGTADAIMSIEGTEAILDVKFTNFADDEYNIWNFDRDNMTAAQLKNYKDAARQSSHYVIMYHEVTGRYVPFYFLIVGKSGWIKLFRFKLTQQGLESHEAEITQVRETIAMWEDEGWEKRPSYKTCKNCPVEDCDARLNYPLLKTYNV